MLLSVTCSCHEQVIGRLSLNLSTTVAKGKTKKNNCQFHVTTAKGMYVMRVSAMGGVVYGMLDHVLPDYPVILYCKGLMSNYCQLHV
jgi:hypothetical protein